MAWWTGFQSGDWAILVAALAMLALATLLLLIDLNNRVHRAFALFLFLRALLDGSLIFEPTVDNLAGRLRGYLFIAVPFAVLYFSLVYRRRYHAVRRRRDDGRRVSFVILGVALLFEALYFWDHSLLSGPRDRPLSLFLVLPQVVYAGIAVLFAHDFRIEVSRTHRLALVLAAVGLSLEPLFYGSFRAIDFVLDRVRNEAFSRDFFNVASAVVAWLTIPLAGLVGWQVWRGCIARGETALARRVSLLGALVVSSAVVPAVVFYRVQSGASALTLQDAANVLTMCRAVWLLGLPILVTYALVKYHLFDADVKIRFAIKGTTLAAIFLGVAFILSEGAQEFFGRKTSNAYIGIFGASLLVFALAPLQHFADRLARAALPEPTPLAELSHPERVRIYREQLELAWSDGQLTRKERLLFDKLRERLGMSPREAALLESEVVAMTPAPARRPRPGQA